MKYKPYKPSKAELAFIAERESQIREIANAIGIRRRPFPPLVNNTTQHNMEKHIHRPVKAPKADAPFIIYRHGIDGKSSMLTDANTFEQACDLARSDRARLRDLNQIQFLERHDVVVTATGLIRQIPVPR